MITSQTNQNQLIRVALLIFSIFIGISGTVSLSIVTLLLFRDGQLSSQYPAIIILALLTFASCVFTLFIRSKFFKKDKE